MRESVGGYLAICLIAIVVDAIAVRRCSYHDKYIVELVTAFSEGFYCNGGLTNPEEEEEMTRLC